MTKRDTHTQHLSNTATYMERIVFLHIWTRIFWLAFWSRLYPSRVRQRSQVAQQCCRAAETVSIQSNCIRLIMSGGEATLVFVDCQSVENTYTYTRCDAGISDVLEHVVFHWFADAKWRARACPLRLLRTRWPIGPTEPIEPIEPIGTIGPTWAHRAHWGTWPTQGLGQRNKVSHLTSPTLG